MLNKKHYLVLNTNLKRFVVSVVTTELVGGGLGSVLTWSSLQSWYPALIKPSFTPPGYAIGMIWTVLFFLMGSAFYLVWNSKKGLRERGTSMKLYVFQLLLNLLWSFAFFYLKSPFYGLVEISFLIVAIIVTIISFSKVSKNAAVLMVPYLLWACFAAYLNFSILLLNI